MLCLTGKRRGLIDPARLPGLELYLRSDQVVGTNGTGAATWPDISGHSRDATQATVAQRPTITDAGSVNGKRVMAFDGAGDQMAGTLPSIGPGIPNTDGYTAYYYFDVTSLTTGGFNGQVLMGGTLEVTAVTSAAAGWASQGKYGVAFARNLLGTSITGWQTFTVVWTTGGSPTIQGFLNGIQSGSTQVWNNATWGDGYTLGSDSGANLSLDGYYGACVVYSHAHSAIIRTGVEAWLVNFFEQ